MHHLVPSMSFLPTRSLQAPSLGMQEPMERVHFSGMLERDKTELLFSKLGENLKPVA